jgi:hypothetical protein
MALGDVLLRAQLIDAAALSLAREIQERDGISLARAVNVVGALNEEDAIAAIAKGDGVENVSPAELVVYA